MSKLVSKQLVDFVKSFEGFSPTVYLDSVNIPTLGYGMTGKEIEGLTYVTEEQATNMLEDLLNNKYASVLKTDLNSKGIILTQNQFDALVSMAYNVGTGGVLGSTLYRNVCKGIRDVSVITANFTAWSYAGGKQLAGLLRRRQDEAKMFFGTGNTVDKQIITPSTSKLQKQLEAWIYWLNGDYNAKIITRPNGSYIESELFPNIEAVGKLITLGHKSHLVQFFQQKLEMWGYLKSGCYTVGEYDKTTLCAVTELQKNWGRTTDGKILISNQTAQIFLQNE